MFHSHTQLASLYNFYIITPVCTLKGHKLGCDKVNLFTRSSSGHFVPTWGQTRALVPTSCSWRPQKCHKSEQVKWIRWVALWQKSVTGCLCKSCWTFVSRGHQWHAGPIKMSVIAGGFSHKLCICMLATDSSQEAKRQRPDNVWKPQKVVLGHELLCR